MIEKQFTLYVENRPGALAKVAKLLGSSRVNIEGVSIAVTGDVGLIQMILSHSRRTAQILSRAKIPYTVQKVSVLTLPNQPGALAKISEKLSARGININYLYCTCSADDRQCTLVISGDRLNEIEQVGRSLAGPRTKASAHG